MSTTNKTKRTAPGRVRPTESTNGKHPIGCRCADQLMLGFVLTNGQEPDGCATDLESLLLKREGGLPERNAARALTISTRKVRRERAQSGGRIISNSSPSGFGLKHIRHANPVEVRACIAEWRRRGRECFRQAAEVESAFAEMGGAL